MTDVGGIPSHNGLRHLASSHVNVIACARAKYASSSRQLSYKHLGDLVLIIFLDDPFLIHKCSLQWLAVMVNRVQSLMDGSRPP